ncbi:MAG: type II glyceraldehyde-3-phosphate dehydrogenase [Candidatus Thermoplasmatota archaeon]|jgi:glyceraldehyde-3-phosphate dehydrogenase (NAD(P))|nr:type II glyceraldehyde-3-phosphate dehydrogenase [Candidatus Thermoplasmatota archaeon]MCL5963582.1 type II glyceraldehyde-3-phosphate dehydrogenase [Candidatus Thermoplasmatota archaeon]
MKVKVVVNGYGTIGKRVADAITKQDDMELIGVTKTRPSYQAKMAVDKGYPLYVSGKGVKDDFIKAGIKVDGRLEDILESADIVVDTTPEKIGKENKDIYLKYSDLKAIWQGGEKASIADASFNALVNYEAAFGKKFVRVVSCNTTALCRTLYAIHKNFDISHITAVIVRRASDPAETEKGPINSLEPSLKVPSHHGPDVQSVMGNIDIETMAIKAPTTLMHLHSVIVTCKKKGVTVSDIISAFESTERIRLFNGWEHIFGTAQIMEFAKDNAFYRGDMMENGVWSDGINIIGSKIYYYQAVHQESIVIPENIDAIRSMFELEKDKYKSMRITDESLGILKNIK